MLACPARCWTYFVRTPCKADREATMPEVVSAYRWQPRPPYQGLEVSVDYLLGVAAVQVTWNPCVGVAEV
jgi:hypothetical protein